MPKVDMIATAGFTYKSRRLKPGEHFEAKNTNDARILEAVKKAKAGRIPGEVPAPPAAVARKIAAAAPASAKALASAEATADKPAGKPAAKRAAPRKRATAKKS